jgi:hypothetical protein
MPEHQSQSDHDILVEVKTIQQIMVQDIKEIKDGTTKQIADLAANKADKKDLESLTKTVEELKTYYNRTIGALIIIEVVFGIFVTWLLKG